MADKLGDLLRDLRNPNTPQHRLEEVYRLANELSDRDEKYKSWLNFADSNPKLGRPVIGSPKWTGSPLNLLVAQRLGDLSVPNDTIQYITFDTQKQFGEAFTMSSDNTKIFWQPVDGRGFTINGYVIWVANGTGYRGAWLEGFDANGNSMGTSPLHTFKGFSEIDNVLPISFTFYFNGFSYLRFYVRQTSGGALTMKDFLIGVTLA